MSSISDFENESLEEQYLVYKALQYEDIYFKDMLLKKYEKQLTLVHYQDKNTGEVIPIYSSLDNIQMELCIEYTGWRFKITPDDKLDNLGFCDPENKVIILAESQIKSKITLLHELIHYYETVLSQYEFYYQLITIDLYDKLSKRIKNLRKHIIQNVHTGNIIHSPFFMLKSLELDIRIRKPLGTIYAYGKEEEFKSMKRIK